LCCHLTDVIFEIHNVFNQTSSEFIMAEKLEKMMDCVNKEKGRTCEYFRDGRCYVYERFHSLRHEEYCKDKCVVAEVPARPADAKYSREEQ
jgi:hypothetical protein